jgi:acyl-CoA reductase-like NAD-dependent aldehyde dehydrogenase
METRLLIRGEQVAGEGTPLAVENPATEETVAEVGAASPDQLDAAIAGAREAARGWAATPAVERAEMLHEVAARMRARTDDLARALTLEGGKPLIENSDEVGWTAAAFDYYAEMGRNFAGRVIPSIEATQLALVVKEPTGVWGANVYTRDLETAVRCLREIRAGTVWINDPLTDNDAGPFGGFKQSGFGRELGQEGLEAFQETKHVHIETKIAPKEWWYPYGPGA